jgi:hypothetical protein
VEPLRLTWRDAAASAFVGTAVVLYALSAAGVANDDLLDEGDRPRGVGLGWAGCVTNRHEMAVVYGVDETKSRPTTAYAVAASILGAVALLAGIVTLLTGSELFLLVLLGALVALWLIATARHAFGWWTERLGDRARLIDRTA